MKKSINLFIHGINGGEEDFDICTHKLSQYAGFKRYETFINLDDIFFDEKEKKYSYLKEKEASFSREIENVIKFINTENTSDLLFILKIGDYDGFDLIDNQVAKLELLMGKLILFKKTHDFNLIGHSQGGIVALKYSVKFSENIRKIVLISTPLNGNYIAKNMLFFYRLMKKTEMVKSMMDDARKILRKGDDVSRLIEVSKTLANNSFFAHLKADWKELKIKPKLYILSGVSGVIRKDGLLTKKGLLFDGLVLLEEQIDFVCDDCKIFIDNSYCLKGCDHCKKTCEMPTININHLIKEEVGNIGFFNKKTKFLDTTKNLVLEITDSLNGKKIEEQFIYKIFNDKYGHDYLKNSHEAVKLLKKYIKSR